MNYKIDRKNRDVSSLNFKIIFPKGRGIGDIEDVKFIVKLTEDTPLANALITKTLLGSTISLLNQNSAVVSFVTSDYDNLSLGIIYKAGLFCKWTDQSDFDENVESLFDFEIKQNFDNNN